MGVSVWVSGPVAVLGVLALLSVLGLGSGTEQFGNIEFNANSAASDSAIYYDAGGTPLCFGNLTYIPPTTSGQIIDISGVSGVAFWSNSSGTFSMYSDTNATNILSFYDVGTYLGGRNEVSIGGFNLSIGTSLGLIAVISGILAVGIIASVRFFGFGLSDVGINTLMKGGAYILIWAIFTGVAMELIVAGGDFYTPIIYLGLTGVYAFGVMGEIGTPSGGGS